VRPSNTGVPSEDINSGLVRHEQYPFDLARFELFDDAVRPENAGIDFDGMNTWKMGIAHLIRLELFWFYVRLARHL
jgi:hypothetical protein